MLHHQLFSGRRLDAFCFAAIIGLAALLRLAHLGHDSIWLDEAASWLQASQPVGELLRRTANDNYPPLHNLILHAAIALFGDAEWSLRLPSAVLGTASVGLAMLTAYRLRGRRAAIVAGLLLALSPYDIWYSREARMYALLEFASLAFAWSILHYRREPGRGAAWLTGLAAVPLLYSHLFGSFVWIALGGGAALMLRHDRPAMLRLIKAQASAAIAFLPWAIILLHRSDVIARKGFWIPPLDLPQLIKTYTLLASGLPVLAILLIGVALAIRLAFDARRSQDERAEIGLLAAWLVVPAIVAAAISLASVPLFFDRYLIGTVPPMILLAVIGFDSLSERPAPANRRSLLAWSIAAVIVATVTLSWCFYDFPRPRDDWRGAARSTDGVIAAADCIVVVRGYMATPLLYYRRDPGKCLIRVSDPAADLPLPAAPPPAIFLFSSHATTMANLVVKRLVEQGWHGEENDFVGVRVWRLTRS